ncbi:hypothetical protein DAEQUDRAFT_765020 [Daedalea quercina L-15889]|uniref:Uncharacterized protein n=1 Tax=Daedalea quercina L-15889 TaxID=1314783 RepID=A0A165QV97_9APHY|nr:hypothetical protein DAEQUDRAFT_765020 [Daedalea quercina L-15889]
MAAVKKSEASGPARRGLWRKRRCRASSSSSTATTPQPSPMAQQEQLAGTARALQLQREYLDKSGHALPQRRIPAVPDLRFEQSYLASIKPYVHIERTPDKQLTSDVKGKGKAVDTQGCASQVTAEVITVQWGRVVWITTRDQIISPLLQGALRGLAGVFLTPLLAEAGAKFHAWWSKGAFRSDRPGQEGHGVGWLRNWIGSLTVAGGSAARFS